MKIKIQRYNREREPQNALSIFEIPLEEPTLLEAFEFISDKLDSSFTYSSSCRSSVCGACGIRVNDREVLACQYRVVDDDEVSPMKNFTVERDLIVNKDSSLDKFSTLPIASDDSTCILCNLCNSSCPVLEVNSSFQTPLILSRLWSRFHNLSEDEKSGAIDTIQNSGVWDCTLCGLCSEVCPQNIDCKTDILMLRGVSANYGHTDPSLFEMSFGFGTQF
jgi:fumarate reductase iron-sulfur subunit